MDTDTYIKLTAEAIGLPIPPEYFAGTVENFKRVAGMAAQVMEFPLPTEVEPAPVYSLGAAHHEHR
jgi:hypothetical protein